MSTQEVHFPETVVGQESIAKAIQLTNRGSAPIRIADVIPSDGEVHQFRVHGFASTEIPAGASADLAFVARPTRLGRHRARFLVHVPGESERAALHQHVDLTCQGVEDAGTARADTIRAGGVVGPMISYDDMLESLRAAKTLTESGQDKPLGGEDYVQAEQLVAPVAARLDKLDEQLPSLASRMGFASTTTTLAFGGANRAIHDWTAQLRIGGPISPDHYLTSFEQAKEIVQVLTGEQRDAPTLHALGRAARWTPAAIAGGALAGGVIALGGGGLVGLGGDSAPAITQVATNEWANARYVFQLATQWIATHPEAAHTLGVFLGSMGISIVDGGGVRNWLRQIDDFDSFVNMVAQIAEPVINHELSTSGRQPGPEPTGEEPTTSSAPSSRIPATRNSTPPTEAVEVRVRTFLDGVRRRAQAGAPGSEGDNDRPISATPGPDEPDPHSSTGPRTPSTPTSSAAPMEARPLDQADGPTLREIMGGGTYELLLNEARQLRQVPDLQARLASVSDEEIVAMIGYTASDYRILNHALRSGDPVELDRLRSYIGRARSGLEALPDYVGMVYRGSGEFPALKDYQVGTVIKESGFTSTSWDEGGSFGGAVEFEIYSSHGKQIDFLSRFKGEKEVLFLPGTHFKVLERTEKDGIIKIKMRELT